MLAAVGLSLLVGIPLGIVAGLSSRFLEGDHAGARRDADRARLRVPDARSSILFSVGPGAAVVSTMIYAIPPAIRITALGHSTRAREHRRSRSLDGRDARAGAVQGAASALAADAPPRGQPDHHVRSLHGRHRRPDRWWGARRRRHERAVLEPGARDPRRRRDRGHGDGARPLDRGGRRPDGSDAPSISPREGGQRLRLATLR